MKGLLQKIQLFIDEHALLQQDKQVLVAISGGPDSIFLAHALHLLGYKLALAHCHFHLREEADDELTLVEGLANEWNVPLHIQHFDTKREAEQSSLSIQMIARKLRYAFFEELMKEEGYTHCATAHHADDQVESILLSFLKGNSTHIFKDIPLKRAAYIRPIAFLHKSDILQYLHEHKIPYKTDSSNLTNDYQRNQIRNLILPQLQQINPSASQHILERFQLYSQQKNALEQLLRPIHQQALNSTKFSEKLDIQSVENEYGRETAQSLLQFALEQWGLHGHQLWEGAKLWDAQVGAKILCEKGEIIRTREGITYLKPSAEKVLQFDELPGLWSNQLGLYGVWLMFPYEGKLDFGQKNVLYLDADRVNLPLRFRFWQQGDKMKALGMKGWQKLSDIFVNEKYEVEEKRFAIVVEDAEQIVGLSGFRIADAVKIRPATRHILKIEFQKL